MSSQEEGSRSRFARRLTQAAAFTAVVALYTWRYRRTISKPVIVCGEGSLLTRVLEHCHSLNKSYYPSPLAFNSHIQTVLGVVRQLTHRGRYFREVCHMADGGCIALDWYDNSHLMKNAPERAPLFLVLHGITGGSQEGYIKWICGCTSSMGWRAVVMNYRGCGGVPLTTPQCYNATFTDDIHEAVQLISKKFPGAPVFAVGYSLGALLLTKYTAEADAGLLRRGNGSFQHCHGSIDKTASSADLGCAGRMMTGSGLAGAAMVSNPFCMTTSSVNLERPWSIGLLYNMVITHRLKSYMRLHTKQVQLIPGLDVSTVQQTRTLRQFDTAATCISAGYPSATAYYHQGSSQHFIPLIKTPSLFLVSQDDPFLGSLPKAECERNSHTVLAITKAGGHCAHLQGLWPFGQSWADSVLVQYFSALLTPKQSLSNSSLPHASCPPH